MSKHIFEFTDEEVVLISTSVAMVTAARGDGPPPMATLEFHERLRSVMSDKEINMFFLKFNPVPGSSVESAFNHVGKRINNA